MPIPLSCSCGKKLRVKDELAGRRVKCPACGGAIAVPAAEAEFEVVEDEPAPAPKARKNEAPAKAGKKPVRAAAALDDDEDEERPRRKSGRSKLDDDEDEDEERPRKKKKRKSREDSDRPFWKTPLGMILNGIGLMILGAAGLAIYFFDDREKIGLLIAAGLCICFGLGSIVTGMSGGSRDEDD